jgi:hypothetical protein
MSHQYGPGAPDEETHDALWARHDQRTEPLIQAVMLLDDAFDLIDTYRQQMCVIHGERPSKILKSIAKTQNRLDAYLEHLREEVDAQMAGVQAVQ